MTNTTETLKLLVDSIEKEYKKFNIATNFLIRRVKYWKSLGVYTNLSAYGIAKQLVFVINESITNFNLTNYDVMIIKQLATKYSKKTLKTTKRFKSEKEIYDLLLYRFLTDYHKNLVDKITFSITLKDKKFSVERNNMSNELLEEIFKEISNTLEVYLYTDKIEYDLTKLIEIFYGTEAFISVKDVTEYASTDEDKSLILNNTVSEIELFLEHKLTDKETRIKRLKPLVDESLLFEDFDEILGVKVPHKLNTDLYFSVDSIILKNKLNDDFKLVYQLKDYTPFIQFYNEIVPNFLFIFDVDSNYYEELITMIKKASTLTYSID